MALGGGGGGAGNRIKAGEAFVEINADDTRFTSALKVAANKLYRFGAQIRNIGAGTAAIGTIALAPFALAAKTFLEFDDAMRLAGAIVGVTGAELEKLSDKAKLLGRTTSFSAVAVAQLMAELGRAGFTAAEVETMTEAVLDLARATGTDATLSATILAATLRQYGLAATDATSVSDLLAAAANKTAVSVAGLGETLQYAGPVMSKLGISLTDTLALAGALGNIGIQGSDAGTALRRLGLILASQSGLIEKTYGVKTRDAGNNVRPIVDILQEIFEASKSLGTADQAEKLTKVFGILAVTSAAALGKTSGSVRQLRDEIAGATGVAAETAKEMDAGIGGAWRRFKGGVEGVAIAVGTALAPTLLQLGAIIQQLAGPITEFITKNRQIVVAVALVAFGMVVTGTAMAGLGLAINGLIITMAVLIKLGSTLLAAVFSPLTLAVVGLSVVIMAFADTQRTIGAEAGAAWGAVSAAFSSSMAGIRAAFGKGDFLLAAEIMWKGIEIAWQSGILFLTQQWVKFKNFFVGGWADAGMLIRVGWNDVTAWIATSFEKVWATIQRGLMLNIEAIAYQLSQLAGAADSLDPTGMAGEVKKILDHIGAANNQAARDAISDRSDKEIEKERLQNEMDIIKKSRDAEAARGDARKQQLADAEAKLAELQQQLADLNARANAPGIEVAPMPREKTTIPKSISASITEPLANQLSNAIKGTFFSNNYRQSLGSGPAMDEAKKQTKTQKDMLKQLTEINDKSGGPKFD